jgi:hypothetical protein
MKMQTCFKIEDSVWLEFRAMCKKHGYRPAELVGAFMIGWIPAYGGRPLDLSEVKVVLSLHTVVKKS